MKYLRFGAVMLALSAPAAPALAHHSFAMFDSKKTLVLTGVVREFQWTNPHSWVQMTVKDQKGKSVEWSIEHTSPNVLSREGWKRTTLRPGDRITVKINPLKDGQKGGLFVSAVFANGKPVGPAA